MSRKSYAQNLATIYKTDMESRAFEYACKTQPYAEVVKLAQAQIDRSLAEIEQYRASLSSRKLRKYDRERGL